MYNTYRAAAIDLSVARNPLENNATIMKIAFLHFRLQLAVKKAVIRSVCILLLMGWAAINMEKLPAPQQRGHWQGIY